MDLDQLKNHLMKHLPEIKVSSFDPLEQGWDSFTVLMNHEYVFRFARRPGTIEQYLKESRLLPLLAKRIHLEVPFPIHVLLEPPPSFIGYRFIAGTPLRAADLKVNAEGYLAQLSDLFRSLSEFPMEEAPESFPVYDEEAWRNRYVNLYDEVRLKLFEFLSKHTRAKICKEFSEYLDDEGNLEFESVLIHGDISSDHIIHNVDERRIRGVIDWGDSCFGDPALDLGGILGDYGALFASRLLRKIGGSERLFRRAIFYSRLIPIYEALFGLETCNERRIEDGLREIDPSFSRTRESKKG